MKFASAEVALTASPGDSSWASGGCKNYARAKPVQTTVACHKGVATPAQKCNTFVAASFLNGAQLCPTLTS